MRHYRLVLLSAVQLAVLLALGCDSRSPDLPPASTAQPSATSKPASAPPPAAAPERNCDELVRDAHALVTEHATCMQDSDCAMTAAACQEGFACGRGVRAKDKQQVDGALADLSQQFKIQCGSCASSRVRCMKPSPVCREGTCRHEAPIADCEQLEREAEALLAKHNACSSDAECVLTYDDGGCPERFACGSVVNKAEKAAFTEAATVLSRTYDTHCGRCTREVAECRAASAFCDAGRCSRRFDR